MNILNIAQKTALVLAMTQLAACSSGPPPKQELTLTQASIRSAEAASASTHAPRSLRMAQQKVETAEALINKKKHDKARRVLTQAIADAELAEATAEAEKSKAAYEELQQSIDLMKEEIARVQD